MDLSLLSKKGRNKRSHPPTSHESYSSDKENQKWDQNVMRSRQASNNNVIKGIRSLGSDQFLSEFDNVWQAIQNIAKSNSLMVPLGQKPRESESESADGELLNELAPLNKVLPNMNSKYQICRIH